MISEIVPNKPGLWLPNNFQRLSQAETRGALDYIGVTLSYRQVYGSQPTWSDLEQVLAPYSLERIVDVVCRISATLHKAGLPWDPETQGRICQGVFGQQETLRILEVAKRIDAEMAKEGGCAHSWCFMNSRH